ncbi:DUF72 domain-containing protein [Ottowia thiooxydans]|uniref:Uncharacterized protein YecE (DUF72 family) n=1 Tax=Ottowia thiooxydans TaxID=219182 RepID=A0ABV2Q3E7_9BURK
MAASVDQASLFSEDPPEPTKTDESPPESSATPTPPSPVRVRTARRSAGVQPADVSEEVMAVAGSLPGQLWLGTSSWTFPGWTGLVWGGQYADAKLSKEGLAAYSRHPLLRTVSLDRAFYRPLSVSQYAHYAAQVPEHFRFVVKAPSLVADAQVRSENGRGMTLNPAFLNADLAVREFVAPALEGLGPKTGALVFQISPLPHQLLSRIPEIIDGIGVMLAALPSLSSVAPDGLVAVEVRDAEFLSSSNGPLLVRMLREARAFNPTTYCLGLHAKMPPIEDQLPILRALWPGPLVCRWNLHRRHGAYGYETAKQSYEPFDRIVDPDLETRHALARVIAGTTGAKQASYVTINNKAEGSAPLSILELAKSLKMD